MLLDLVPILYQRGAAGVPSTTVRLPDLRGRITSIDWTITDQGGFESASLTFPGTVDEFLWWQEELMASLVIAGPHAQICWEGAMVEVRATLGQETHSRSIDGMANRVRCTYTTVNGMPGTTATVSDTTSQARYGIKDLAVPLPTVTSTEAEAFRDRTLDKTRYPVRRPSSTAQTGELGQVAITLVFAGWYTTLDWVLTSDSSTTNTVVSTQFVSLLTDAAAVNAFISTSTTRIATSTVSASEYIADDTPYRAKFESLLAQGTGSARYAWGVYEDRTFVAEAWAGASPTTIQYQRRLGSGHVVDATGARIDPWDLRPNRMYQIAELLELNPATNEQDSAARYYVARVSFHADASGVGAQLEPSDSDDLSATLATLEARGW